MNSGWTGPAVPVSRRYAVPGQQALYLELMPGERLQLRSEDGEQCCELIPFDAQARDTLVPLLGEMTTAAAARAQLAGAGHSARALGEQLERWQLGDEQLDQAWHLVASQLPLTLALPPKASAVRVLVLAPGVDMPVDGQIPATGLQIEVTGATAAALPSPLATPLRELRVPHSSARAYEVKAGEWIQVIDVAGKQCSDFVAFDRAALEAGEELMLDGTATRTLAGTALPQPGLFSRFCDQQLRPMLEVVQDTVGRHDSFLLACAPKYYEDSGYFGHSSCTDNFNRALAPFGIRPRFGWPAINFFFNTRVEPCGAIGVDEPWSQPGDYVLMRAQRDLVCASSACPDDIDPANGWCPTDIHVRIYGAEHRFPRAIAHRIRPEEPALMTRQTAFHDSVTALTRQLVEYKGYWLASAFDGWGARAEYLACRERVAVMDLSPLRKFEVLGPDAEALLDLALTRNVRRVAVGEVVYSALCQATGGMIDDGTLFRMGQQAFRWICGDPYSGTWLRELAIREGMRVSVRESTDQLHNLAVQGPESRRLLESLIWNAESQPSVTQLRWFHFMIGRLGGPEGIPLMISRTGYTGELGFEVWCHPDHGAQLWEAIWQAGQPLGIVPLGLEALDMLRVEAGLIFAGHEFCPETSPFEAGIGFTVALKTKETDFVGRAALVAQAPASRKRLVGLRLYSDEPVAHGDQVYSGRFPVGVVTSAVPSPLLGYQIALCRLAPEHAEAGTELEVGQLDGLRKRLKAVVAPLPFHDPQRLRVRS